MTEWNAAEYSRRSSLQEAMAQEVLALLDLNGSERIRDVGCGDGKITAEIASRAPRGDFRCDLSIAASDIKNPLRAVEIEQSKYLLSHHFLERRSARVLGSVPFSHVL